MRKFYLLILLLVVSGLWLKSNFSRQNLIVESETPAEIPSPEAPKIDRAPAPISAAVPVSDPAPVSPFEKVIAGARAAKTPEEAETLIAAALKDNPDSPELLSEMGMIYLTGLKQPRKALPFFEKSLTLDGSNGDIASLAANIYVQEKMTGRGAKFLSDLMQRNPDNHTIPVALADILAKEGRQQEGLELLEDTKRRAENEGAFSPYMGMMYLNAGKPEKAVEVFRKVVDEAERSELAKDPQKMEWARLDLANALLAKGDVPEAESLVKGVLERAPTDKYAKELLERVQKAR